MKPLLFFFTIALFSSCNKQEKEALTTKLAKDSLVIAPEKLDLTVTHPKSENRKIPKSWKSLGAIQQNWIEVKKDENGYLIYEPCDGYTRSISFKNGYLHIQWQMEPEVVFNINKFTRGKQNTTLMVDIYAGNSLDLSSVSAEIIDAENGLVLWEFNGEKWLMTPLENSENFRHIKNNCPDSKRGEMQFLEVDEK